MSILLRSEEQILGLIEDLDSLRVFDDANPVLDKTAGTGIKVDRVSPTFPWRDLIGNIGIKTTGPTAPTLSAFRGGNAQRLFFPVGTQADMEYHIPHDYLPGSDVFLHLHWGHNGTAIGGNLVLQVSMSYAKGFNQEIFTPEKVFNMTIPATNLTVAPRFCHIVSEVQISASNPTATQFNSSIFEVDGEMIVQLKCLTVPTITGGTVAAPYWGHIDLHYQSTGRGTKNKQPNFDG